MAKQEVTGRTESELVEYREEFLSQPKGDLYDFEDWFCLFQIPYQPEDYDGPARMCVKTANNPNGRCNFHTIRDNTETLPPAGDANFKHGGYANHETLKRNMTDYEEELYEEVLSWAEKYHIDKEEDPSAWDDLKMLAMERVRQHSTGEWLDEHGETEEVPIFDPEGNIVDHKDELTALSEEHRRITNLVMSIKRDLGLTRKEQLKHEELSNVSEGAQSLSEAMNEMVTGSDKEYDPSDYEYEQADEDGESGDGD